MQFFVLITVLLFAVRAANAGVVDDKRASLLKTKNQVMSEENRAKAREIGQKIRQQLKDFRGGNEEFYQQLFDSIVIVMCDEKTKNVGTPENPPPNQRFVPEHSPFALKDSNGKCIKVTAPSPKTKHAYSSGKCEVRANCFWEDIVPGDTERRPVYSTSTGGLEPDQDALTLSDAQVNLELWLRGLVVFIAPGIILACLSALTMVLFLLCRCVCNQCGGRNPKEGGYSCMQKLIPVIFMVAFSAGIVACAGVSLFYNAQVEEAVTGLFNQADLTLNVTDTWIVEARQPLINIKDEVIDSVKGIRRELNGTDFIEDGLTGLSDKLNDFGKNTANVKLPRGCTKAAGYVCVDCDVCKDINTKVKASNDQMDAAASSGIDDLKKIRKSLSTQLIDISSMIKSMVADKVDVTESLRVKIKSSKDSISDIKSQWDGQDAVRQGGVLAMFALGLVVVVLGLVAIILKVTPFGCFSVYILHISYLIGFIALIVGFIMAAVLMTFSILLSDTCEITGIMAKDWTPAFGKDNARGINACFQNESLLEAFNLTKSFEFADSLPFPDNMNMDSMLDFSEFDNFNTLIDGTGANTFKFDKSQIQNLTNVLNQFTGNNTGCNPGDGSYTVANIATPWLDNSESDPSISGSAYIRQRYSPTGPLSTKLVSCDALVAGLCKRTGACTYENYMVELYDNIVALKAIERDSVAFVDGMKANMTGVSTYIGNFKSKIRNLDTSITTIKDSLIKNLVKYVQDFKDAMYCNFMADGFDGVFELLCDDMMPALLMISLNIFLMGLFLIPLTITAIILAKRFKNVKKKEDLKI